MVDIQLGMNEGILLRATHAARYDGNNEIDLNELFLTTSHLIFVYEKSTGFFSKSETTVDRIPLTSIAVVNGIVQVDLVNDDDYGKTLQIVYSNGKRELIEIYDHSRKEYPKWKAAIADAVVQCQRNQTANRVASPNVNYSTVTTNPSSMKFCSACGTKLDPGARFCKGCGMELPRAVVSQEARSVDREVPPPSPPKTPAGEGAEQIPISGDEFVASPTVAKDDGDTCSRTQCKSVVDEPIRERRTVYEGEIHKCPNCGEVLESFVVNCPTCGHEFRGAKNSTSVREFFSKLEEIERSRPAKKLGLKKVLENQTEVSETDLRKISLIRSFVIPNTKEDLFEFLVLASSNINMQRYNDFDSISESEQAVSDAWEAKFEQAYEKAKLSFGHTPEFKKIQAIYEKKSAQITESKKKRKYYWIGMIALPFICVGLIWGLVFAMSGAEERKIDAENERLETIVEQIYDALEDENYVLARAKAATLVFSGPDTDEAELAAAKWEKTRTEMLAIIDAAASNTNGATSEADEPSGSEENRSEADAPFIFSNMEVPADFIAGYEKADFKRYNSPASENGLGNSKIYFCGTLNKTELLEADGTTSILGYVTDDSGNEWLIQLHFVPAVSKTAFDSYVGEELALRGVYSGFSGTKEIPVVVLDEMIVLSTGENVMGMQKLLIE